MSKDNQEDIMDVYSGDEYLYEPFEQIDARIDELQKVIAMDSHTFTNGENQIHIKAKERIAKLISRKANNKKGTN